jgi:hypothetical protein
MLRPPASLTRAAAFGALSLASLVAPDARAQIPAPTFIQQGGIQTFRKDTNIKEATKFNRLDCQNDSYWEFALTPAMSGTLYDVQVWMSREAADNCADPTNQTPATGKCRQVAETVVTGYSVIVHVRDVASDVWGAWDGGAGADVCESTFESEVKRVLHFYYVAGGSTYSAPLDYAVTYDLLGPGPPNSVKAGVGENLLVVSYQEATNAAEVSRYRVYAEPVDAPPIDAGGGEGGAFEPGGSGSCTSNVLIPGKPAPAGVDYRGESNASTLQVEAKGLTNGVTYATAVAGVDAYFNSGNLSALACGTPEPVTGFFEAYRDAGGQGGGGFCAIGAGRSGVAAGTIALALFGLVLRRARRRDGRPARRGVS